MSNQVPSLGRIVLYRLTDTDTDLITQRRNSTGDLGNPTGGEEFPAVVVRVFADDTVNLHVLLDGQDTYWATSRKEGTEPGTWCWPPRVGASS